ncbi:acyltransferase family protein [Microbacterium sp. X-17]|uniref:acyltransferase family protein n=1 Tax=Microbacterium sp. X-17 TaxID=3144404 RepID=UPI0031F5D337
MHTTPAAARFAGLDGLRAVAVLLVVVYHLFPGWWLRGGFIGVDVFFVISGFLITTLLLRETATGGRIGLVSFWRRRARRLVPALLALLAMCSTFAWLIGGDVLAQLGPQLLGALTFSYNWVSIAGGSGYFAATSPELFRNLWSLAVEEQFYVLWPLLLPLLLLLPRTRWRVGLALGVAVLSTAWMGVAVLAGGDLTRAYFGTDTHAFGLLAGVALAFGWHGLRARTWMTGRAARTTATTMGALALAGLVGVALIPETPTLLSFPGAIAAAVVLTAVVIVAGLWPGAGFGRMLDVAPLRWIGDRSYGIYLWHWPLLVLLVAAAHGTTADVPVGIGLAVLGLTFAVAEFSYRALEMPVRRHGFRGALRGVRAALAGSARARFGALAGVAAAVLLVGGTSAALAAAPDTTSGQSAVAAGAAALAAASPGPTDAPPPPLPTGPSPQPVTGDEVTAVGDSVMLASAPGLLARLPGIQVDAEVSRSMWAAPGILRDLADRGQLRPFVVVALGTNGAVDPEALDDISRTIGPGRCLVLVNAFAPRDWIDGVNAELRTYAQAHPDVEVADWAGAIAGHQDLLAGDDIHPGEAGGTLFAGVVATALDAAERERAQEVYDNELRARLLGGGVPTPH